MRARFHIFTSVVLVVLALATWTGAAKENELEEINVGEVTVMVSSSRSQASASKTNAQTIQYPKQLSKAISASAGEHVHIVVPVTAKSNGKPYEPHQAMLRLSRKEDGSSTYITASSASKNEDAIRISVDVANRGLFGKAADGGAYTATLLLGDAKVKNPTSWDIGTMNLYPPSAVSEPEGPLYSKPLLHESEVAMKPLKEITHIFKDPEPEPHVALSMGFSLLVVVPWLAYYIFCLSKGFRVRKGIPFLPAVVFHSCLLAILCLYLCYWFGIGGINMFSTLGYLTVLAVPTCFSGNRLLRQLRQFDIGAPADKKDK